MYLVSFCWCQQPTKPAKVKQWENQAWPESHLYKVTLSSTFSPLTLYCLSSFCGYMLGKDEIHQINKVMIYLSFDKSRSFYFMKTTHVISISQKKVSILIWRLEDQTSEVRCCVIQFFFNDFFLHGIVKCQARQV